MGGGPRVTVRGRTEVLVFRFDAARARFEGTVIGALERAESGGAIRVLEVLVVGRDADSGKPAATRLRGATAGLIAALADFRLDRARRAEMTAPTVGDAQGDIADETLDELARDIAPGGAIVAVLLEHVWAAGLAAAVARSGGRQVADELVPGDAPTDLTPRVLALARGGTEQLSDQGGSHE
jgi:hypothetical protein